MVVFAILLSAVWLLIVSGSDLRSSILMQLGKQHLSTLTTLCPTGLLPFKDTPSVGICSCGTTWLNANSDGVPCSMGVSGDNNNGGGSDNIQCPVGQLPFKNTPATGICSCGESWAIANFGDVRCGSNQVSGDGIEGEDNNAEDEDEDEENNGGDTGGDNGEVGESEDMNDNGSGQLCLGNGWGSTWSGRMTNGEPPLVLTFAEVGQVWSEVNGNDACISAVTLSAGESLPSADGSGVIVRSVGHTLDPATQMRAYGIWQSLPGWYCSGARTSGAFPQCEAGGNAEWTSAIGLPIVGIDLRDPCKQAYLTQRINMVNCGDCANNDCTAWGRGPIQGAGDFCNGGWTGNLPVSSGGRTCAAQFPGCTYFLPNKPYYTNNPMYVEDLGGFSGAKAACPTGSPHPPPGGPAIMDGDTTQCPIGQQSFKDTPSPGKCSCGTTWSNANSGGTPCGGGNIEEGDQEGTVSSRCPLGQLPFKDTPSRGVCSCGTTWSNANSGGVQCM